MVSLKKRAKSVNTKLGPQLKDPKSSYQVRAISALFCKLVFSNFLYKTRLNALQLPKLSSKLSLKKLRGS